MSCDPWWTSPFECLSLAGFTVVFPSSRVLLPIYPAARRHRADLRPGPLRGERPHLAAGRHGRPGTDQLSGGGPSRGPDGRSTSTIGPR